MTGEQQERLKELAIDMADVLADVAPDWYYKSRTIAEFDDLLKEIDGEA